MKKILFSIVMMSVVCLFAGCEPDSRKATESQDGTTIYHRRFELDGHTYIEFYRGAPGSYDNYTGFVHDPECLKNDIRKLLEED